jgi:hypothetical protein
MHTQLSEQMQTWKAGEFERHVQRYIAANHDPSAPANRWQPSTERTAPTGTHHRAEGDLSWRKFNGFCGVNPTFRHDVALTGRAA